MLNKIQVAVAVVSLLASGASAQSLVHVGSFQSQPAASWPIGSMEFVGSRVALGSLYSADTGLVRFLIPGSSGWQFSETDLAPSDSTCREFGQSIVSSGNKFAVGSRTGHVYIYELVSSQPSLIASWRADPPSRAQVLAFDGATMLVGLPDSNGGQGGGQILQFAGAEASLIANLVPGAPAGKIGWSGGISGDTVVLSAEANFDNSHAMTWRRGLDGNWAYESELFPANPVGNAIFGCAASIEGNVIAVGARDDGGAGFASGACFVFERGQSGWTQTAKLTVPEAPFVNQEAGASVRVRQGRVYFSASGSSENGTGDRGRLLVADRVNGGWTVAQTLRSPESGVFTSWGIGPCFGPGGTVAAFGFDCPVPFVSWRLRVSSFAPPQDCDSNGTHDVWQSWTDPLSDADQDLVPDVCEAPTCRDADFFPDRNVNGIDLGILLAQWGPPQNYTVSDINDDGMVDGIDLGLLLAFWGPCPY